MKKRQFFKGFTLVEMIVVFIIIGIISAMVLPKLFGTTVDAKVSQTIATFSNMEKYVVMQKRNNFKDMTDNLDDNCNNVGGDDNYLNDLVCKGKFKYNSSLTNDVNWEIKKNELSTGEISFYIQIQSDNAANKKVLEIIQEKHQNNNLLVIK